MGLKQDIRSVTWLKNRAAEMLDQINATRSPVVITQKGEPRAVIQDPESFEEMRSALAMLKLLAQGERDIQARRVTDHDAFFAALRRKYGKRKIA